MRKRFRNFLAVLAIALVGGLVWLVLQGPDEPVYQGKTLSFWLEGYDLPAGTGWTRGEAEEALRQIGVNATPPLLKMLSAHDPPFLSKWLTWASKRHFLGIHYTNPADLNRQGFMGFQALGPKAASAVPQLIKILERHASISTQDYTARTLAVIGPEARAAVPLLLRAATNTSVMDHSDALWALGEIHAAPDMVVPVLSRSLRNSEVQDRLFAAIALGKFRGEAKSAVPALVEALTSPQPAFGSTANFQARLWQRDFLRRVEKDLQQIDPANYALADTNPGQVQFNKSDFLTVPEEADNNAH